ncbi:hypothetical protein BH09VER1_BH09VER1_20420 [soil metagenome]
MPDSNPIHQLVVQFGLDWPKFAAQIILFLVLYTILNKFAFAPIVKMLEERRRRIEESQSNADKIKKRLAEAELRYQETLTRANEEGTKLLEQARLSTEAITQQQLQKAIKDAEAIIARANEAIVTERTKMVDEVRKEMVHLVIDTTAKVVGKVLTPEDQKRLSDETTGRLAA